MGPVFARKIQLDAPDGGALKELSLAHLELIEGLSHELFPAQKWNHRDFAYFLTHTCRYCWGVFNNDELVSFILGLLVVGELDVVSIGTARAVQRVGHARLLLRSAMQHPGIKRIFLEVRENNLAAIRLYQTLGFEQLGVRKKYYEGTTDAIQFGWVPKAGERGV